MPPVVGGPADKNPIAKKYAVEGIPATFLIGPDGKAAAKDLRGEELRKEVQRLVGQVREARANQKGKEKKEAAASDEDNGSPPERP